MSKLTRKPTQQPQLSEPARFERFNLTENPFPSQPTVNKDSKDKRINGEIYEMEIRRNEYKIIEETFLRQPQANPNHLRLGYIIDSSYIGRGNGKSAFLVNLLNKINKEYCLDISDGMNKCFAVYVFPELGGRTKTFTSYVDVFFQAILQSNIIKISLATLRLEAIVELYPDANLDIESQDENELVENLNSREWFKNNSLDTTKISQQIYANEYLQELPPDFPLFIGRNSFILRPLVTQEDFEKHYKEQLRKSKDKIDFVFSQLVQFFLAAGFNGAYILVDDFERIPDFQSARQKKDFALELRSCLFDGMYTSAKIGFYNFLLVLHAGVSRLISEAWASSGMENRSPIFSQIAAKHIIKFEKLSQGHATLLLKKYLDEYRIDRTKSSELYPFTEDGIKRIGELAEFNASKMLKMAFDLLEKIVDDPNQQEIDSSYVNANKGLQEDDASRPIPTIENAESVDLSKLAGESE